MKAELDRYGLFKWLPEGFPDWVEGTSDVGTAKERVRQLWLESAESDYFVQDFVANVIVASSSDYGQRFKQLEDLFLPVMISRTL